MVKLVKEKLNRIILKDSKIETKSNIYDVSISIFNEAGEYVKDKNGQNIDSKEVSWDNTEFFYYVDIDFHSSTPEGYLRIIWNVELKITHEAIELSDENLPQEIELVSNGATNNLLPQIVPISFFLDNYIAKDIRMDAQYKQAVEIYVAQNRRDLNRWLLAAQSKLEMALKTVFFTMQDTINRDYYMQDFGSEFWINQANYRPIVSIDHYSLVYGAQNVEITKDIKDYILVDKKMGTFEFLPTAVQGNLFTALINGVSGLGISIMNSGNFNRVPFLFRITYTYGLDFVNLPEQEKEGIRQAIARHTIIQLLPILDPSVRITNDSKTIDGVTKSQNSGMAALLKTYSEEEKEWLREYRRKYALDFDMAVA